MSNVKRHHNALPEGYRLHWYEIRAILGRGGFGITYLALDTNLNHEVAIKEFLPTELAVRAEDSAIQPMSDDHTDTYGWGLSRFITEAQTLAQFRHPNIVLVHSVFEANNTAYMVMEYERGQSLEEAYNFKRVHTEEELLGILIPLMSGLERIHQAGFVHRDIKPKNIYLREDGRPVLLDFGSARQALGVETRTLTTLVSPGYAPFEQYNATRDSDKQGPWTDIYALGATIYRGVTGKSPIDALTRANAKLEGRTDVLELAAEVGKDKYSEEFLTAIDRALGFSPEERPQSVAEWRAMFPLPEDELATVAARERTMRAAAATPASEEATQVAEEMPEAPDKFTDEGTLILDEEPADAHAARGEAEPARGKARGVAFAAAAVVLIAAGLAVWQLAGREGDAPAPAAKAPDATDAPASSAPASSADASPSSAGGAEPAQAEPGAPEPEMPTKVAKAPPSPEPEVLKAPEPTLADIDPLLAPTPCTRLAAALKDRSVVLRGHASAEDAARVVAAIENVPGVEKVRDTAVRAVPPPICAALRFYAPLQAASRDVGHGTVIRTTQAEDEFVEGDRLIIDVASDAFETSFLYVDYYANNGTVVHLLPSPAEENNRLPSGQSMLLGEPGDVSRWDVAGPFGTDLITVLASDEPLFPEPRDEFEDGAAYLKALEQRVAELGKGSKKGSVSADFVVIKTKPNS